MASVPVDGGRRALLSVTDKTRLTDVAAALRDHGYQLIASGGTAGHLRDAGFLPGDSDVNPSAVRCRCDGILNEIR